MSLWLQVLFRAYFTDGLNITDERALRQLLAEVGMEEESAIASLSDPEAVRGYEEEVKEANRKGLFLIKIICRFSGTL